MHHSVVSMTVEPLSTRVRLFQTGIWLGEDEEPEGRRTDEESMVFGCIKRLGQLLQWQDNDQGDIANHIVFTMQCLGTAETQQHT